MTELNQVYKCDICGNIVQVIHKGQGLFSAAAKPMTQAVENTVDAAKEKHVPVLEETADGYKVKVGSVPHPMEEKALH